MEKDSYTPRTILSRLLPGFVRSCSVTQRATRYRGIRWLSNELVYELGKDELCVASSWLCPRFRWKSIVLVVVVTIVLVVVVSVATLKNVERSRAAALYETLRARSTFPRASFAAFVPGAKRVPLRLPLCLSTRYGFVLTLHPSFSPRGSLSFYLLVHPPSLSLPFSALLVLFLSLSHSLFVARGKSLSHSTRTGRVPEIIVRIDPHAGRAGWIYSRARGERETRTSSPRYLIVPR